MIISLDLDGVICQWKDLKKEERIKENYNCLPPIKGAREGLAKLDCWTSVITARHYRGAQEHVQDWLADHWLAPNGYVIVGVPTSEKWRVMQALGVDIHVDDNIRVFNKVPSGIVTILFKGDHNQDQDWPLTVSSWPELVEKIKEIERNG